jgi:hypothetical protein
MPLESRNDAPLVGDLTEQDPYSTKSGLVKDRTERRVDLPQKHADAAEVIANVWSGCSAGF